MPLPPKIADLIPALGLIPHPEGGFFVETFRSGSAPMSTQGQTDLDCDRPDVSLVATRGRAGSRPDGDARRQALTSIYWVPTVKSRRLLLAHNHSDHVHYYQGGRPFHYSLYDPATEEITKVTLGADLQKGQRLQVCVRGGLWKCGILDTSDEHDEHEYCVIGEAVAPGFDFHDFSWVTKEEVRKHLSAPKDIEHFLEFVNVDATEIVAAKRTVAEAADFYTEGETTAKRAKLRS
eukprot:CAMPEP_0194266500 /NCGR_PEP_ID=MMETSP0169-20130528/1380_1 /TAXON_ID=218684 /ORGANISM="Corethron pennatum, Strain L29A3" /LENGTH=234 /DNA_ID=CAMNT_0039007197 /DNA_START=47 /DNA_END=751 /DNA_ORIENTATION=+